MNDNVVSLAYELCRIPSITGNESHALRFLETWLLRVGFVVEKITVSHERYNIFASFSKKPSYGVIYCTHIDTVAPFIEPRIDEKRDLLLGRGACDAKGILSSMIFALLAMKQQGFDDAALLITVGEEESSDGARASNSELKDRARFLVVGEPTDLKAAYAQKGSLVFDLIAEGIEAHSSRPYLGESSIHKLVKNMNTLLEHDWPQHEVFGETFLNFGEIVGGSMRNVLAKNASAKGIMRTVIDAKTLSLKLHSLLSDNVVAKIISASDPFSYFLPQGFASFLAGFGSDAPYLSSVGTPILVGPGSLDVAHTVNEHISFSDLHDGISAYVRIAHQIRKQENA